MTSSDDHGQNSSAEPALLRACEYGLILVGLVLLWTAVRHRVHGDGYVRYEALSELLLRGRIVPMRYSFVQPLLAAPMWLIGLKWQGSDWWCARFNVVALALGLFVLHWLLRDRVADRSRRAFVLILIGGSMFAGHVQDFHGEVFTALAVGAGLLAVAVGRPAMGWSAAVAGVVNTPAALVGLAFVSLCHAFAYKRLRVLAVVAAAAGLILLESWVCRGNPFRTGYAHDRGVQTIMPYSGRPGFSYPFLLGILSICLSFGKGLVFFAPGLLLGVRALLREQRPAVWRAYVSWLCFLAGLIAVYSRWWAWYGGWFWGPRFLLFASIPASLAIAVRLSNPSDALWPNLCVLLVAALSFWVGISGAVFFLDNLDICRAGNYALEHLTWYVPEFSVLWRPFVAPRPLAMRDWLFIVYAALAFVTVAVPMLRQVARQLAQASVAALSALHPRRWGW